MDFLFSAVVSAAGNFIPYLAPHVLTITHLSAPIGHKFAGNVILYTNEGRRGVWYGRVSSCHCEAIVDQTLIGGKVIKELYRGSMTHSFDDEKTTEELQW